MPSEHPSPSFLLAFSAARLSRAPKAANPSRHFDPVEILTGLEAGRKRKERHGEMPRQGRLAVFFSQSSRSSTLRPLDDNPRHSPPFPSPPPLSVSLSLSLFHAPPPAPQHQRQAGLRRPGPRPPQQVPACVQLRLQSLQRSLAAVPPLADVVVRRGSHRRDGRPDQLCDAGRPRPRGRRLLEPL